MFEFVLMIFILVFLGTFFFCVSLALLAWTLHEVFGLFNIDPFKKFKSY